MTDFSSLCNTVISLFLASRVAGIDPKLAGMIAANSSTLSGERLLTEKEKSNSFPSSWERVPMKSATATALTAIGGIATI
ncbi:hypothetical protein C8J56DRAFT_30610 [Mycena floridula]|nr:hypothetical protein C8J56DRAFT_30610 [Mycena floridula]